jgi:D-lactate dehydrogenase (cytochrome)
MARIEFLDRGQRRRGERLFQGNRTPHLMVEFHGSDAGVAVERFGDIALDCSGSAFLRATKPEDRPPLANAPPRVLGHPLSRPGPNVAANRNCQRLVYRSAGWQAVSETADSRCQHDPRTYFGTCRRWTRFCWIDPENADENARFPDPVCAYYGKTYWHLRKT